MFIIRLSSIVAVPCFVNLLRRVFTSKMSATPSEIELQTSKVMRLKGLYDYHLEKRFGGELTRVHIIDGDTSVNRTEDVEVYLAIEAGDKKKLMRELHRDVTSFYHYKCSKTPLQFAINLGHHEFIAPLIDHGCNMKDATLCISDSRESLLCLQELMKYKIDMNERDDWKRNVLCMTILDNPEKFDLIKKLLDVGFDINSRDYFGRNILQGLALKDFSIRPYLPIAELLLDRGINMEVKDGLRQSPVESMVWNRHVPLLRLLLRRGGTMESNRWSTIAHRSFKCLNYECLNVIIKYCIVQELQGKAVDNKVKDFIKSEEVSEYYEECLEEVNDLKEQYIRNTKVSFYDILFESTETVAKYMRNEYVLQGTERSAIENSEFLHDIEEARAKAIIRRDLEDSTSEKFGYHFKLPKLCSEIITRHLENQDLQNFLTSWKL